MLAANTQNSGHGQVRRVGRLILDVTASLGLHVHTS